MAPFLGVAPMDRDHATLERLFADVAEAHDRGARSGASLPSRTSRTMLRELEKMRKEVESCGAEDARQIIATLLPRLVEDHIANADTVSAAFLRR